VPGALCRELPLGTGCAESKQPCAERIALSAEARIPVVTPESTGWTLLRRTVRASRVVCSSTAASTAALAVNMSATSPWRATNSPQKTTPIASEVADDTAVANRAPYQLPAPSSLATRTLRD
jgi:hypothetical protein